MKNGRLYQTPVREIETLWRDTVCLKDVMVEEAIALPGIAGRRLDLTVTMQASSGCSRFILRFADGGGLFTEIRYDPIQGELTFDRSCCGSRRDIPHIRYIKTVSGEDGLKLRLILDRDCAELFINDGAQVLSARIDTPVEAQGISFAAVGGPVWIDVEQHML